ncbi:hypothetical protein CEE37_10700 [candidate division LCP-89 bacterium B3_LCP]|uniref:TIR domain-containing protein n=1 Tax=candidate division LCP-89 bacterium B3_LCP TaxID=2012998 RepID=A0A532UXQ9_UNCL8|nr:MAG: hypothetical protein CEE37_10700 [candidate division LCP-89 bacterium B3_LCP]
MDKPTIFISYSHKDKDWMERLKTHLEVLQMEDILDIWVDTQIETGDDWFPEIKEAMNVTSVAIFMISANFLTSKFIKNEEVPRLMERRARDGVRVFPVIVKPCPWQKVNWLSRMQVRPKDSEPLLEGDENHQEKKLSAIAEEIADIIGPGKHPPTRNTYVPIDPENIEIARLPTTDSTLLGREGELEILDKAWESEKTNVISLVAFGGVGKSALVNVWLNNMAQDHYRGAQRVYGYSFYSQGTSEDKQASADPFIAAALEWFGDPDPTEGSPWQKGERLANLVREGRTLLILDGLEPIQYPPGEMGGQLRDPGMQSLLRGLSSHNPGLCVVTTRLEVEDLKRFKGSLAEHIDLEKLTPEAGAKLLEKRGAVGSEKELKEASEEFEGHALALNLLGNYLSVVHEGDIRKRDQIAQLTKDPKQGGHARRVMKSYERMFEKKPELDVLYMMGLFDRPAEGSALETLKAGPAIAGLTTEITNLSYEDWKFTLENLRKARLLAEKIARESDTLDCHPLIREHFGEKLKSDNAAAWKEAHRRLYEYYKATAKELPETFTEMLPLYAAVAHGCQAGLHQEALDDVYFKRIQRRDKAYNTKILGAIGAELAVLSNFFDPPWRQAVKNLTEADQGFILNYAGFDLRALGRLGEAIQSMRKGLEIRKKLKDWGNVAIQAGNLSELNLTLGEVRKAREYAEQSVEYADKSDYVFFKIVMRADLADALHQSGELKEAENWFVKAEEMQVKLQPEYPLLYSQRGFLYCDLLLGQGKYSDVLNRAKELLKWRQPKDPILDIALENLTSGRAYLLQIVKEKGTNFSKAETHLNEAVDGLRKAGTQDHLPRGLLARAELYRVKEELENCEHDLEEAMEIATLGQMRLHETDCHLGYVRLYSEKGEKEKAREHLGKAKKMIDDTGYHRRDGEVKNLEFRM